jgi:hypothetical protein
MLIKQLAFLSISPTTQSLKKKVHKFKPLFSSAQISIFSTFSVELCTLEKKSRQSFLWTYVARCEQHGENGGHVDQWDPYDLAPHASRG